MKNKFILLSFVLFLIPTFSWSEVVTNIEVQMQSQALKFQVTINSTESQKINLKVSPKAQFEKQSAGKFVLEPNSKLVLTYSLPIDFTKSFFSSEIENWYPVVQELGIFQKFIMTAKTSSGFELIHSATGQNQEDVAFVLGAFKKYSAPDGRINIYLAKEDDVLAKTLIGRLGIYLKQYESQLGTYPYDQFSVVESPDEIGYAFPKMTWIGSQLLRFPFILTTSLPHELLHSWWGNGVFVDYEKGNWCEGLTAFGADYSLLKEADKKLYRLKAITNFLSYSNQGNEIPLSKFVSRGEDRSLQAIGYDKAVMVFVMLEDQLGPMVFQKSLKTFYQRYKFKKASFADLFKTFSEVSGKDLSKFENFWIHSKGLVQQNSIGLVRSAESKSAPLNVNFLSSEVLKIPSQPVAVQVQFVNVPAENLSVRVKADGSGLKEKQISFPKNKSPISYILDPDFRLFRDLSETEKPMTFSQVFAAQKILLKDVNSNFLEAVKSVFPDKDIQNTSSPMDPTSGQTYFLTFEQAIQNPLLEKEMAKKGVSVQGNKITMEQKVFDSNQEAIFISLKWGQSKIVIFSIHDKLPVARWFQRWTRYGAQSYIVLTTQASALQGIWLDTFKQEL